MSKYESQHEKIHSKNLFMKQLRKSEHELSIREC